MRKILYLSILVVTFYSCSKNANNTKITGKLEKSTENMIYLQELTLSGHGFIDSTKLSSSGRFKFKLHLDYPGFFKLHVGKQRGVTVIAYPKESIYILGKADSLYQTYNLEGSQESSFAQSLDKRMDKTIKSIDSLNTVYRQFINNPNIENIRTTLKYNYYRVLNEQRNFTIDFIQKHPASLASIMALYQQTDDSVFVLYQKDDRKYYSLVDSMLFRKYPNASYVKALHNNLETINAQFKKEELKKILSAIGAPAQNFSLPNASGKEVSLASFKGKTVLLYVWASWCDTCRKHNAKLVETYYKYKSKGFEIVAVSLDQSKDAWLNAIQQDKIGSWTHLSDLKYWKSAIVPLYNIETLPISFLIDKDGAIIGRFSHPDGVDDRLSLLFK
jgi:peroxiredoxin